MSEHPSIQDFLSAYSPEVAETAHRLLDLVQETVPNSVAGVFPGWKMIGFRVPGKHGAQSFGFITPKKNGVVLGFEYGKFLRDRHRLLQGEGGRQSRHVAVSRADEIRRQELADLIHQAARVAMEVPPPPPAARA